MPGGEGKKFDSAGLSSLESIGSLGSILSSGSTRSSASKLSRALLAETGSVDMTRAIQADFKGVMRASKSRLLKSASGVSNATSGGGNGLWGAMKETIADMKTGNVDDLLDGLSLGSTVSSIGMDDMKDLMAGVPDLDSDESEDDVAALEAELAAIDGAGKKGVSSSVDSVSTPSVSTPSVSTPSVSTPSETGGGVKKGGLVEELMSGMGSLPADVAEMLMDLDDSSDEGEEVEVEVIEEVEQEEGDEGEEAGGETEVESDEGSIEDFKATSSEEESEVDDLRPEVEEQAEVVRKQEASIGAVEKQFAVEMSEAAEVETTTTMVAKGPVEDVKSGMGEKSLSSLSSMSIGTMEKQLAAEMAALDAPAEEEEEEEKSETSRSAMTSANRVAPPSTPEQSKAFRSTNDTSATSIARSESTTSLVPAGITHPSPSSPLARPSPRVEPPKPRSPSYSPYRKTVKKDPWVQSTRVEQDPDEFGALTERSHVRPTPKPPTPKFRVKPGTSKPRTEVPPRPVPRAKLPEYDVELIPGTHKPRLRPLTPPPKPSVPRFSRRSSKRPSSAPQGSRRRSSSRPPSRARPRPASAMPAMISIMLPQATPSEPIRPLTGLYDPLSDPRRPALSRRKHEAMLQRPSSAPIPRSRPSSRGNRNMVVKEAWIGAHPSSMGLRREARRRERDDEVTRERHALRKSLAHKITPAYIVDLEAEGEATLMQGLGLKSSAWGKLVSSGRIRQYEGGFSGFGLNSRLSSENRPVPSARPRNEDLKDHFAAVAAEFGRGWS